MPAEALIQEPPPAEVQPPVASQGAEPQAPDVVPESVKSLLKNLNLDPDEKTRSEPEKAKNAAPAKQDAAPAKSESKPSAEKTAPPAADFQPGLKVRQPKVVRPELPLVETAKPAPMVKEEPYKPDPQWEQSLEENEREMLSDARFMEERFPDKYKGLFARTAKFIKEHADFTARDDFDDQSPEYRAWLDKNQPKLTRQEIREIEEVRVADRVRKEYDGKLADVQHKLFVRDVEPKIEADGKTIFAQLSNQSLPDEVIAAIRKDGFEKASQTYGLEIETAQAVLTSATDDIIEFKRITTKDPETGRPLQPIVDDPSNPKYAQHQRLSQMVADISESFKNTAPAQQQLRNGKWFVTRDEWNAIRPDQRHRFWTFTNAELIEAAKQSMKSVVADAIEKKRGYITKLGFTRAPRTEQKGQQKSEPPQPTNTPRLPAATPVPGETDALSEIDARAARLATQLGRSE